MNLNMKKPCKGCPMLKTSPAGWLGYERIRDILGSSSFVCHKTLGEDYSKRKQCAGHMILMGSRNEFYRLARRLNVDIGLKDDGLVFDSVLDCIEHHSI